MTQIGMSASSLDEIELRLLGADHRPWVLNRSVYDENGRAIICKGGRKAENKAQWRSLAWGESAGAGKRTAATDFAASKMAAGDHELVKPAGSKDGPPPDKIDERSYIRFLSLFKLCDEATEDMANFVANAPQDVETLLAEVKRLRVKLREAEQERDEFKKEMLSLRVEKSGISDRLSAIRRTLRDFKKELDA